MSFQQVSLSLAAGFLENCRLFLETLLFSIPLGLIISFGSMSKFKPLSYLVKVFVWCIRGTPLMIQLLIIFYLPGVMGNPIWNRYENGRFVAALVAFVFNYACYFSEIYRGGIESIAKGQYEAGYVLGLSKSETFFKIIFSTKF